jgi:uncharacterized membrane protein YeaQ/YmgE (transglycosylase-associated protein family)
VRIGTRGLKRRTVHRARLSSEIQSDRRWQIKQKRSGRDGEANGAPQLFFEPELIGKDQRQTKSEKEDSMDFLNLIISLISGAVGGNIAGAALKDQSLGTVGNSIAGILVGGVGGMLLQALGASAGSGGIDPGSLIGSIASGGVGGSIVMVIVGLIKSATARA